ncbi:MAG: 23S rRNA (uracil(1939)-C(5))-methyltransferase RlmD, partial [Lachnospira sp.]|nr:23S rRNA (uracil(1939)-C(5))-methyltransferase RlmD [Lachnospira sp.]
MGSNIYDEKKRVINCESAEKCGSCAYAGMKYDNELKIKQGYVDKLFKDICPVDKITGMYRPVHYRNKVHAVVGEDKNGNIITGTYEENSHNIVPVSDCLLEDSQCSSIIATLRDLFKSFKYKPYNEDKGTGFIRHILLRKGFSTKEIMLVIV